MFKKTTNHLVLFLLITLISLGYSSVCYANSAEPPSILILVPNAPDDLQISINNIAAAKRDKRIETYYIFYSRDLDVSNDHTLEITTDGSTFKIVLNRPLTSYNNIFTLDLENQVLTPGKSLSRSVTLVSLRLALTLLLEGFIFFMFGYRKKRSWIAFVIINLITQGLLNVWINGFGPMASYIIIALIFIEVLIIFAEIIAFLVFVKEHHRLRTISYVLIANLLSLIVGGYLITVLPI